MSNAAMSLSSCSRLTLGVLLALALGACGQNAASPAALDSALLGAEKASAVNITAFAASAPDAARTVTLSWRAENAAAFQLGVNPKDGVQGLPQGAFRGSSARVSLPSAPDGTAVTYAFTLRALGARGKAATKTLSVSVGSASGAASGDLVWKARLASDKVDAGRSVLLRPDGGVVVAGSTFGSLFASSRGATDGFLARLDASGARVGGVQFGSGVGQSDDVLGAAIDKSGNVFVVGATTGALHGESRGTYDAFVAKYSPDLRLLWAKQLGTSGFEYAEGVAVDPSGNAYVVGSTTGALFGTNGARERSDPAEDAFVVKFDPQGAQLWARQLGGDQFDAAYKVATDASGNVFVAGASSTALFTPFVAGSPTLFVTKFDSSGGLTWGTQLSDGGGNAIGGIGVDGGGNAYVAGSGNLASAPQVYDDAYLIKYAPDGRTLWSRQIETGGNEQVRALTVDARGNSFLGGALFADEDAVQSDAFVWKYDASGTKVWARRFADAGTEGPTGVTYGLALDALGNVYATGSTESDRFGANPTQDRADAFVLKLKP